MSFSIHLALPSPFDLCVGHSLSSHCLFPRLIPTSERKFQSRLSFSILCGRILSHSSCYCKLRTKSSSTNHRVLSYSQGIPQGDLIQELSLSTLTTVSTGHLLSPVPASVFWSFVSAVWKNRHCLLWIVMSLVTRPLYTASLYLLDLSQHLAVPCLYIVEGNLEHWHNVPQAIQAFKSIMIPFIFTDITHWCVWSTTANSLYTTTVQTMRDM